ncbi:MAG: Rrf2 family transcriptional regulator [Alphaproteobacteria bacterium]|nr:MAG: Rrf2 family transcriptional regulator [Alphaproteobacteria bacterium]
MINLSRKTQLALEAVLDVAYNARPDPVQSKDITQRQGIPQRYLEQVMQHLVRAGILKGVRGPRGGYRLARERRRISVGDVVRVVDAMEVAEESLPRSSLLGEQIVGPVLDSLQEDIMAKLDAISFEQLCAEAQAKGIEMVRDTKMDFNI